MNSPLIISASRRTDIPAFYADWFMSRMEAGVCEYINIFNQKPVTVDLSKVKFVVFWTKNPIPLMRHLEKLDRMGIVYYFQYTLNNYSDWNIESGLDDIYSRIETFKELSQLIGKEKVVFRYDPMILIDNHTVEDLLENVLYVANRVNRYTEKMVFSFADLWYRKVQWNFDKQGISVRDFSMAEKSEIAARLSEFGRKASIKIATCSETLDLSLYGIEHNKCVDPELILKLVENDPELKEYLKGSSGQRNLCGCAKSVDIGMYDTCIHNCTYCYATKDKDLARMNYNKHNQNPSKSSII